MTYVEPLPHAPARAVLTGLGAVSALGTGCDEHWASIAAGRDGFRLVERFQTDGRSCRWAATWRGWDGRTQLEPGPERDLERCAEDFPVAEMAISAAREAFRNASLDAAIGSGAYDPARVAIVVGSCFGQSFRDFHEIGERIARALGISGPCIAISTACSSSTNAIGLARDLVALDRADVVLAGGADVLLREVFAGFAALGVLSAEKCAPFSEPSGTTLGEGAGFVVVERPDRAAARAAACWAAINGYGLSADAFHETTPDPSGSGIGRAIRGALADAGWKAGAVEYVSAHATGTDTNDRTEWAAIERAVGPHVAVSGSKSLLGHTQGAAGVLELIVSLLAMRRGCLPPTLHFRGPRPGCPADPIASETPRRAEARRALKLSAAFGGANAVLAFESTPETPAAGAPLETSKFRRVLVRGLGIVGPSGVLAHPAELLRSEPVFRGPAASVDLRSIDPSIDPRRLDRSSRYLTAAAALSLSQAGLRFRGAARDRAGIFAGGTRMPEESARRCRDGIRQHGALGTSAAGFARMSVNSPAGACAKLLGLRGPTTTVSIGEGTGLLAIALAAEWLALRDDADFLLAASADELNPVGADTEAAVSVLLERPGVEAARAHANDMQMVAITGLGIAGPDRLELAARQALGRRLPDALVSDGERARGCLAPELSDAGRLPCGFVDVSRTWGRAEACRSAIAFAVAVELLRSGSARSILVTSARSRSSSVALLVTSRAEEREEEKREEEKREEEAR